jgi:predicted esterase
MNRFCPVFLPIALCALLFMPPLLAQETDLAEVPSRECTVGKDKHKQFFLIGEIEDAEPPEEGYGLLVIMPGGSGSKDFHSFVKRIYKNAVPVGYLAVQPVAVKWTESQEIIWPTRKTPVNKMKFTTEEFVLSLIKQMKKTHKIDPRRIFTLSWSSSGPAAYCISLEKKTPVTGSYVAMSVFKPDTFPSLKGAKGQAYFIEHGREDKKCLFSHAEDAVKKLEEAKAKVMLEATDHGHGWQGDMYGRIKKGILWLEKNHRKIK